MKGIDVKSALLSRTVFTAPVEKKEFLLKEGQVLLNKFKVEGLLADGGFAQVYA